MGTIITLLIRDFKNIVHSRPVLITLIAFCIIPALYALLNIKASWDPYSPTNTSRLPIAVINNDEGTIINNKSLNVGDQVIEELKKNHDINWVVTNDWQGNDGLDQGKYYALIDIPNDFSSRLATLTTGSPQKPTIIYKSNEKLNAAATILSGQAKDTLTQRIRTNFTKVTGREILEQMNLVGKKLNTKKPQLLQIRSSLLNAIATINKTKHYLNRLDNHSKDVQAYLKNINRNIPKISSQINNLQAIINHGKSLNMATRRTIDSAKENLSSGLDGLQSQNSQVQSMLTNTSNTLNNNGSPSVLKTEAVQLNALDDAMVDKVNNQLRLLDVVNNLLPNNGATSLIKSLASVKDKIKDQRQTITKLKTSANENGERVKMRSLLQQLIQENNRLSTIIDLATTTFSADTSQSLDQLSNTTDNSLDNDNEVVQALQSLTPKLRALQSAGNAASKLSSGRINKVNNRLDDVQQTLTSLDKKAGFINSKNLTQLTNILEKNPDLSNLLSSPVTLQSKELYNLGKFGYAAMPFYAVLSIWVGILLLTAIITWRYKLPNDKHLPKPNLIQQYVGKFLLFLSFSFLQTTFTLFGEMFILGIRPNSLWALLAIAYTTTFIFSLILFTLVFLFGNAGKVFGVLLLIVQIFGTGGIYPLQTIPHDLADLAPLLPFTYAIRGFREALAGPDWQTFIYLILILGIFGSIFLLLTPLKRFFIHSVRMLEEGMKRSKL